MPALNKAVKYAAMAAATVGSALVSSRKRGRRHLREFLARINRMRCGGLVIAVTGSSAKTTTVSLLSHILAGNSQVLTQALGNGLRRNKNAARHDDR